MVAKKALFLKTLMMSDAMFYDVNRKTRNKALFPKSVGFRTVLSAPRRQNAVWWSHAITQSNPWISVQLTTLSGNKARNKKKSNRCSKFSMDLKFCLTE